MEIDVVYPKENKKIFAEIGERSVIDPPIPNRKILRCGKCPMGNSETNEPEYCAPSTTITPKLIPEMITARLAMEFGREVFAAPGNVTQPMSFRPNLLIQQGAKLVAGWEDVMEGYPRPVRTRVLPVEQKSQDERIKLITSELPASERVLYGLLGTDEAKPIDDLVESSGLSSSEVLATVFDLEMKGVVRQLPGKQFLKVLL